MTKRDKLLKRTEEDEFTKNAYREKEELFEGSEMLNEFFPREVKEQDEKKVYARITLEKLR